jgi:hypothetical protein
MREEIAYVGQTSIPQRITALLKQGMYASLERKPLVASYLGEVNKVVKRLLAERQAESEKNLKEIGRGPCLNN